AADNHAKPDTHATHVGHGPQARADFFFSSRRRHTRFSRDWSSDLCSSDLRFRTGGGAPCISPRVLVSYQHFGRTEACGAPEGNEIGRASCRERVWSAAVAVSVKKKATCETKSRDDARQTERTNLP